MFYYDAKKGMAYLPKRAGYPMIAATYQNEWREMPRQTRHL